MTLVLAAVLLVIAVALVGPRDPRRRVGRLRLGPPGPADAVTDDQLPASRVRAQVLRAWRACRRRTGTRRSAERRRALALETCDAFAAELRAGRPVRVALTRASPSPPPCPEAVAACRWGADVVAALRADAERSGVQLWASLAACWSVGEGSGAALATSVDRLVAAARADEEVRREVVAALAAPRATAQVLAVLPLFGIALGTALGASPVPWLLGTAAGRLVALVGLLAAGAGVAWTARIAAAVERRL